MMRKSWGGNDGGAGGWGDGRGDSKKGDKIRTAENP